MDISKLKTAIRKENWTLFLDRDGVINHRIPGAYVRHTWEFSFYPGSLEAIAQMSSLFYKVLVVTNQQGIGKKLMTHEELHEIHNFMVNSIAKAGGRIDRVYYSPRLASENPSCRKPNTGMGLQAKTDFPNITFSKSIMIGDSLSDIEFGNRLGMQTVLLLTKKDEKKENSKIIPNFIYEDLAAFADALE